MAHANRIEQLEDLRNVSTNQDFYERLAAGKFAAVGTDERQLQYIPVPITIKAQLGNPTALAIGAFATTLTTLSTALMGFRGVAVTNAFIGDFLAVAGIGMNITAQWELVLGNSYAYTVLSAFGFFYLGFGFIVTPSFGVADAYGGSDTAGYNNAIGLFTLLWAVFNIFFLIGSLPLNLVYIGIFATVQGAFTLVAAGYLVKADAVADPSKAPIAQNLLIAGGAFAFASGMLGFYTVGNLMCQEALKFSFPMGDTSRFFKRGAQTAGNDSEHVRLQNSTSGYAASGSSGIGKVKEGV